jgi:hypothetical protein
MDKLEPPELRANDQIPLYRYIQIAHNLVYEVRCCTVRTTSDFPMPACRHCCRADDAARHQSFQTT